MILSNINVTFITISSSKRPQNDEAYYTMNEYLWHLS